MRIKGGTVTWAEPPGSPPNYIFPFSPLQYFAIGNTQDFEDLLYRPLYWFGNGNNPTLNTSLSLAAAPIYKDGDKQVVVNLKPYKWSNGETMTATDVLFWMNMDRADKEGYAGYDPGAFPDNVTNVVATGKEQVTFDLNRAYSPTWFTYNELDQITPMPQAWDITKIGAAPGSGSCSTAAFTSISIAAKTYTPLTTSAKACNAVYDFLSNASGFNPANPNATTASALSTFATSPIWKVVDGPWRLTSFNSDGKAVFQPNPDYSGPVKPTLSKFVELPFTSNGAEYNALVAGAVDYGYLPASQVTSPASKPGGAGPNNAALANKYYITTEPDWAIDYFPYNFNSTGDGGQAGPIFRQLYFRQAMQYLVDQPAYIAKIYRNYASPTYGPVPTRPPTWASPTETNNPYPYNPAKARALLTSHGWIVKRGGISTCSRAGSGPNDCGHGIKAGAQMSFTLQYYSGNASLQSLMNDEAASWGTVGIKVLLEAGAPNTVFAAATPCANGCSSEMGNSGGQWEFTPDTYPTGDELFLTGAGANYGEYNDPTNNANIVATYTKSGKQAIYTYEDYLAKQLPDVWQPLPLTAAELKNNLHIGAFNPLLNITPETWYYTTPKS